MPVTTWMNFQNMQSERRQSQNGPNSMITFIRSAQNTEMYRDRM